jgi:hypothetical protein
MDAPEAFRDQEIQRLSDHLGRGPSEDLPGTFVEHRDALSVIHGNNGIGGDRQDVG